MSFILDALRKSEHERQRSTLPGLSQVPLATPPAHLPRWAFVVIGMLAVAVLVLGGAWWQSLGAPARVSASSAPRIERSVELPPPVAAEARPPVVATERAVATPFAPARAERAAPLADAAANAAQGTAELAVTEQAARAPIAAEPAPPSAAALLAQGVALPPLRLELHAFSERPGDRFVFINGRKYVEGERLPEGPQLIAIEPSGAVLVHNGQRFLLVPD